MQRPEIYEIVWGGAMRHRDRSVDVVVRKIRGKLERLAPGWRYIHTHFGVGYRFNPERASPLVADGASLDIAGIALGQVEGAAE